MAYNTAAIKKDIDGKPIPQLYNEVTNEYEVLKGQQGSSRTMLYDVNGNPVDLVALITAVSGAIEAKNLPTGASTEAKQDAAIAGITNAIAEIAKPVTVSGPKSYYGKSTDIKPTVDIIIGSTYFEIDTVTVYMWDGTSWEVI